MSEIRLRPIQPDDAHALYGIFRRAIAALTERFTEPWPFDAAEDAATWPAWQPLYGHLQAICDHAWLAEVDGAPVGYARSMRRGDVRELTELFMEPGEAGRGAGRRLLEAAFPAEPGVQRLIVATGDPSAQSRYVRHGFTTHAHLLELEGLVGARPDLVPRTDLVAAALDLDDPEHLDAVAAIDEVVLGHRRDAEQRLYAADRHGRRFLRDGRVVGYGWMGSRSGPVAALDPADVPAMLAALEAVAAGIGRTEVGWNVPGTARPVAAWLLARGFRLWRMPVFLMSDGPALPGRFDRYVVTSPPFFV